MLESTMIISHGTGSPLFTIITSPLWILLPFILKILPFDIF